MSDENINYDELGLDPKYISRIKNIDERIKGLQEHRIMWARAGGVGGRMAMQAIGEIDALQKEKERIIKGTQQEIDKVKEKQEVLETELMMTNRLRIMKRIMLKKKIANYDEEIEQIKKK